jgi:hypothetical protein
MELFFKDKKRTFQCSVLVEGADIKNTTARLVLKFPESNKNYLYYGTIDENSVCSIDIPALREVKDTKGQAILEVISESTFFEPWTSDFELKESKTVKVEMIDNSTKPKLNTPSVTVKAKVLNEAPKTEPTPAKPAAKKPIPQPKQSIKPLVKESKEVTAFKKEYMAHYNKKKGLIKENAVYLSPRVKKIYAAFNTQDKNFMNFLALQSDTTLTKIENKLK